MIFVFEFLMETRHIYAATMSQSFVYVSNRGAIDGSSTSSKWDLNSRSERCSPYKFFNYFSRKMRLLTSHDEQNSLLNEKTENCSDCSLTSLFFTVFFPDLPTNYLIFRQLLQTRCLPVRCQIDSRVKCWEQHCSSHSKSVSVAILSATRIT